MASVEMGAMKVGCCGFRRDVRGQARSGGVGVSGSRKVKERECKSVGQVTETP